MAQIFVKRPIRELKGKELSAHTIASFLALQAVTSTQELKAQVAMDSSALTFLLRKTAIRHWSKTNNWLEDKNSTFNLSEPGLRKINDRLTGKDGGFSVTAAQVASALSVITSSTNDPDLEVYSFLALDPPVQPVPPGNELPESKEASARSFTRSEDVKSWVLDNAASKCEACGSTAPFFTDAGTPYLEMHHVQSLSEKGADSVTNCVALCPNCHRALHYAVNRLDIKTRLYEVIERLRK